MASKKNRILLVEDDLDLTELLTDYYSSRGYEIKAYTDPTIAIRDLQFSATGTAELPFELVLTDLMLPNMDGLSFIKKVKDLLPGVPIIVSTADGRIETALEAINLGAFDFIVKPIHFPQLTVTLQRAVHFGKLQKENQILRDSVRAPNMGGIIGKSAVIRQILDLTQRVAKSGATVLINGESGTGKELIARFVHQQSPRAKEPFIAINCSAIPENLLESELFGYVKGAFTGANDKKTGLFEEANGGTLFLDEIGDLPLPLQAKLLRVLQDRTIKRLGENQSHPVDVRVIAATHKNLDQAVKDKTFREDLFFRLNVIPIRLPALRERREDILPLAEHFLKKYNAQNKADIHGFTKAALERLLSAEWSGNIRELENTIERAVILCQTPWIDLNDLQTSSFAAMNSSLEAPQAATSSDAPAIETPVTATPPVAIEIPADSPILQPADGHVPASSVRPGLTNPDFAGEGATHSLLRTFTTQFPKQAYPSLRELENAYIPWVLERVNGVKDRAAKVLGIDRKTLYRKLSEIHKIEEAHEEPALQHESSPA